MHEGWTIHIKPRLQIILQRYSNVEGYREFRKGNLDMIINENKLFQIKRIGQSTTDSMTSVKFKFNEMHIISNTCQFESDQWSN